MEMTTKIYEDGRLNVVGGKKKIYGSWNADFTRAVRNVNNSRAMDAQSRVVYARYFGKW